MFNFGSIGGKKVVMITDNAYETSPNYLYSYTMLQETLAAGVLNFAVSENPLPANIPVICEVWSV